ncbi:MAG: [ribosomal protein S5]-alanine N-acetyltransferase [Phycisphaerales bacterium]|jgi:ribosomal-protein-alanine N-acetyltransferase|nr:[ribosomal protein S5]-alanine N-acetyltransferase [Phycisphaerales bacterium]
MARMEKFLLEGARVGIRRPTADDCAEFIALMQASAAFHHPWGEYPKTVESFAEYLSGRQSPGADGFLICVRESGAIAGVVNLNAIVRGYFDSAFLGYYVGAPFARRGFMTEGLKQVTKFAFEELKLHRVEANIQPGNAASIALARKCGFRYEGFSPRYLKILGEWRDHERWALLADDPVVS